LAKAILQIAGVNVKVHRNPIIQVSTCWTISKPQIKKILKVCEPKDFLVYDEKMDDYRLIKWKELENIRQKIDQWNEKFYCWYDEDFNLIAIPKIAYLRCSASLPISLLKLN